MQNQQLTRIGHVIWRFKSKKIAEARLQLGLPSSNIKDTNINKTKQFLISLHKLSLLRFTLFCFAGDGTICCTQTTRARPGELAMKLQHGIRFDARDDHILPLIKEALEPHGLQSYCSDRKKSDSGINRMTLHLNNKDNQMAQGVLEAIMMTTNPKEIMHPKLKLL